ncbi:MAG: Hint domain-containing protein [Planctomycetota bacterium]
MKEIAAKVAAAGAEKGRQVMCKLSGACFLAGTLVAMADGSFVPIEEVVAGQEVRCEQPAAMPGLAGTDLVRAVTTAGGRVYEGAIITVAVARNGITARVSGTPEHPFWCVNRHAWVPLAELVRGDWLDGRDGDVVVVGREVAFARVPVFNLAVDGAHSYRISELGVLVHNGCPHTPDQAALVQLANEHKKKGLTASEAGTMKQWADETGMSFRGPESHPTAGSAVSRAPHYHVAGVGHIPAR